MGKVFRDGVRETFVLGIGVLIQLIVGRSARPYADLRSTSSGEHTAQENP